MDVAAIRPRLLQRIDELGLTYKEISLNIGRPSGWLSDVLKGKQKTIKSADLDAICAQLDVTEDWLRGRTATGVSSPSLFAVAPTPSRPAPTSLSEFIQSRREEIDAEIEALRSRIEELQVERRELIEAAKAVKKR